MAAGRNTLATCVDSSLTRETSNSSGIEPTGDRAAFLASHRRQPATRTDSVAISVYERKYPHRSTSEDTRPGVLMSPPRDSRKGYGGERFRPPPSAATVNSATTDLLFTTGRAEVISTGQCDARAAADREPLSRSVQRKRPEGNGTGRLTETEWPRKPQTA
jgi:hypothetical protein